MKQFVAIPAALTLLVACGGDDSGRGDASSTTLASASATLGTTGTTSSTTDTDTDETTSTTSTSTSTSTSTTTSAGDPTTDVTTSSSTTDDSTTGVACVPMVYPNALVKQPIDILLYIDASSSMAGVIKNIKEQIAGSLFSTLEAAEVDYTVTIIAPYPLVCIDWHQMVDCAAKDPPMIADHFYHASIGTASSGVPDHYASLLLDPWATWWRPDALKVIVGFTDGEKSPNGAAAAEAFEMMIEPLIAPADYVVHTISGLTPAGSLLQPDAPLANGACNGGDDSGPALKAQQVSIDTGGLRASVCGLDAQALFDAIAQSSITSSIACDIEIPGTMVDDVINPDNLEVRLEPGGGEPVVVLENVADEASCVGLSYWLEANVVHLCPDACAAAKAKADASVEIEHCVIPG
ncbi:MAG: hypothetical protein R3B09_14180 [Nannocystaceae bacterium]